MSATTALLWIGAAGAVGLICLIIQGILLYHLSRAKSAQAYLQGLEDGWREGWDDRDNDRYPGADPYQGKHHVTAEEAEAAISQFLIDSGVEAEPLPPLPKRIPGASI